MKLEELLNEGKNKRVTVPFNGIEGHRSKLAKAGIKVVSTGEGGGGNTEATLEGPEKNIRQYLAKLWNLNTDDEEIDELFEGQLQEEASTVTDAQVLALQPGDKIQITNRRGRARKPWWTELDVKVDDNGKPRKREWLATNSRSSITIGAGSAADYDFEVVGIKRKGEKTPAKADAKAAKAKPEDDGEKMYFGIGCWQDPYNRGGDEWFIIGPYETSKEARAGVNRKHENGQPRGIRDWSSGPVKVVDSVAKLKTALTKLKLQIPKAIETGEDIYPGEVALWRPNEL